MIIARGEPRVQTIAGGEEVRDRIDTIEQFAERVKQAIITRQFTDIVVLCAKVGSANEHGISEVDVSSLTRLTTGEPGFESICQLFLTWLEQNQLIEEAFQQHGGDTQ